MLTPMTSFRLILCAAGVAAFALLRFYATSASPETGTAIPKLETPESKPSSQPPNATVAPSPSPQPVITHLEFRDKLVTIKAGAHGPIYEVRSKDGRLLRENLTAKELQAREPGLYKLIQTAIGSAAPKDGSVMDARIDLKAPHPGPAK